MADGTELKLDRLHLTDEQNSPPPPQPQTVEEAGGGGEKGEGGAGEEEVKANTMDAAPQSMPPPAVALPNLSHLTYSPIFKKFTGRRKKKFLNAKQRAVAEQRLELLSKNFRPVPFSPGKALDFSAHEQLFRALGLWEFAHLNLDVSLRPDLLAHLIAYYDPSNHRSYVNGTRITVSRLYLARAIELPLPAKKEKGKDLHVKDPIHDLVSADGATPVLLDFMSNYMLFDFEDDMCILPPEIIQAIQFVKDGDAHKVDWAAIMWILVEKELLDAPKTGTCCYASHLQHLIEHQHPFIFSKTLEPMFLPVPENEEEEVSVADELIEEEAEINVAEGVPLAEEEVDADIKKMRSLEDLAKVASERHNSEFGLTLGESVMTGFVDCKLNEEGQWFEEGKNGVFGQCLQRCNSKAFDGMDLENLTKVDEEEKQEKRFADDLSVKFSNMEGLTSSDHLEEMENVNIPYAQPANSLDPSSGVFLTTRANSDKTITLGHSSRGSTYLGNNGKRKVDEIVNEEDQFDHGQKNGMRSCEAWGNLPPFSFDECIDQIQCGLKRAKILFAEKDQEITNMEMQVQYLNHSLQEKEQVIRSLKLAMEGQQDWQMVVREFEVELCLVSQMMLGYKKALKETRGRFADFRKLHPHPHDDESLYKDVPGEGLVLSAREFEKHMLLLEEDKRQKLIGTFGSFKQTLTKFEECEESIMLHDTKLVKLVEEMKQLKDGFIRSSSQDT